MMGSILKEDLIVAFDKVEDPRMDRTKKYPLQEILFLVLVVALMGIESWRGVSLIGNERIDFLRRFLPYKNGIPSHQTIGRVFSILKPGSFEKMFVSWSANLYGSNNGKQIALDGKTLRGSYDNEKNQSALHLLNACAVDNGITLAHLPVDTKTNEITVVPDIIDMLDIKGAMISVDALNTQKNIAKKIIDAEADYTLALKGNHKNLNEDVSLLFDTTKIDEDIEKDRHFESTEKSNGRITIRKFDVIPVNKDSLDSFNDWQGLKSVGKVETTTFKNEKKTIETRLYLLSYLSAKAFADAARGHWGIENKLHWSLDVVYGEDA
jgi:predicted transposase YbfD/YdcC